jgi:hypothetical protein
MTEIVAERLEQFKIPDIHNIHSNFSLSCETSFLQFCNYLVMHFLS